MRSPLISVVIPVQNQEKYVQEAVASVLSQTFDDYEIIIVDDFSQDNTVKIVRQFEDPRIRIIQNTSPQGVSKALNLGLIESNGQFIARLDGDDVMVSTRLQKQADFLRQNPEYGLVGSWMRVFGLRKTVARYPTLDEDVRLALLFRVPFGHPAVTYRKRWDSGAIGLYNTNLATAQDFDLWGRISQQWKCANLPEELTAYRVHNEQSTARYFDQTEVNRKEIARKHQAALGLSPLESANGFVQSVRWWSNLRNMSLATKLFSKSSLQRECVIFYREKISSSVRRKIRHQAIIAPAQLLADCARRFLGHLAFLRR